MEESLRTAVQELVPMVRRIAGPFRSRVYATADQEDLLQEGFLGLSEAAVRYDAGRDCSLATYGSQRARGAMLDHVRTLSRRSRERSTPQLSLSQEFELAVEAGNGSPESSAQVRRFQSFLEDIWPELSPQDRQVLRLRFFEGKTVREAAQTLAASAATVWRREKKVLQHLRERYMAHQP